MKENTKSERNKTLYRLAWSCEIFAVLVGIYLAVSLSYGGLGKSPDTQDWINFGGVIAILLFGAFVELTKIPLIVALNKTRSMYRKVCMSCVFIFLCVFTFDTLLQGTEQFLTLREKPLEQQRMVMVNLEKQIKNVVAAYLGIPLVPDETVIARINGEVAEETKNINVDIERLEKEKLGLERPKDTPAIKELKVQRTIISTQLQELEAAQMHSRQAFAEELTELTRSEDEALKNGILF